MSTLEYLDEQQGSVSNFGLVPWETLHTWLSTLNGNPNFEASDLPRGVNRGRVLEELERRRMEDGVIGLDRALRLLHMDRGFGKDWRDYESQDGLTHLEELLVYQPDEWRKQAREYYFRFRCDLSRESSNEDARSLWTVINRQKYCIFMKTPILTVLFHHTVMDRTARYQPLNFLLAYGVSDPLPALLQNFPEDDRLELMKDLSPLDYFLEFQNYVSSYRVDKLKEIGKDTGLKRICLIKELDFCDIIGQRLAKQMIRQAVVFHVCNHFGKKSGMFSARHPLSMVFAGPSGNGKTELAKMLAQLMNKPNDDYFIKVDSGKLTDATEVFGKSGAYQGAQHGSALNNFVLKMSLEPQALGIILLDEIEKASQGVIHALYQVIDKGEWTNKRLSAHGPQTDVIPCNNLIFIMTTNSCDLEIKNFAKQHGEIYSAVGEHLEGMEVDLTTRLRGILQYTYPFTEAFIGRVGRIVPFLLMANKDPDMFGKVAGESLTVAKLLIERQQEKFNSSAIGDVRQFISPDTKHHMASIVVQEAIEEAGVRSIQMAVESKMGDRLMNSLLLERGGIEDGSHIRYFTREESHIIDFRVEDLPDAGDKKADEILNADADVDDGADDLYA